MSYLNESVSKRFWPLVLLCLIPLFCLSQHYRRVELKSSSVTPFYDINDTNSLTVIDKINNYNTLQNILHSIHNIEDDANNRIHFELHITGGGVYSPNADSSGWIGAVSFKINLCNPKIPNASDILVDIERLHNLVSLTNFRLPAATVARIDSIELQLKKYNRQFWWKRISLGATIPFAEPPYYNYASLDYKNVYIFVGYDLGDVITILVGMNKDKNVIAAASIDLSTPLSSLAEDFKQMISRLLRLPARGSYYWYD